MTSTANDATFLTLGRTLRFGPAVQAEEFAFWEYEIKKDGYAVFTEVVDDNTFEQVRILGWLPIEECGNRDYWYADTQRSLHPRICTPLPPDLATLSKL
jgi:hypothetical protein